MSTYTHLTLEKSEETLEFILNIISEGVWDWNALTGKVYRNSGWFRMLE
jgi:PAS domain-containing protein